MTSKNKHKALQSKGVDCGLVAMLLKMNPEERIMANDNSLRAIWELRDAFTQRKNRPRVSDLSALLEALSKAEIFFIKAIRYDRILRVLIRFLNIRDATNSPYVFNVLIFNRFVCKVWV
jgi:hypothetical protein